MANNCNGFLTDGITLDCKTMNAPVGVDKDLILVNYDEYDRKAKTILSNVIIS